VLGEPERGLRLARQTPCIVRATLTGGAFCQGAEAGGQALLGRGHGRGELTQLLLLTLHSAPVRLEGLLARDVLRFGSGARVLSGLALVAGPLVGPLHAPSISPVPGRDKGGRPAPIHSCRGERHDSGRHRAELPIGFRAR
jgi:hypothetical protein